jgi:hypothetical protein
MLIIKMDKFKLEGHYNFYGAPNGRGELTGEIEVSKDGSFEGEIYDNGSRAPNQFMKGHLVAEEGLVKLLFLKIPDASNLANLAYDLSKPNESFEGKYSGQWGALPYKVEFNKDIGLFTAQIDLSVAGIGDSTEISLYKK